MGFDGSDIKRINEALRLAEQAAEIDRREYGYHANEMRRFAESLGQLMVVNNDPRPDAEELTEAATQVHLPANECPDPPPNSGGLPFPDQP
jgi:hypothetical protein